MHKLKPPGDRWKLGKNAVSLFLIQGANYVLPLLLIPYLSRTLGSELYGVVFFGIAIVQFSLTITDYGFSISMPYFIAKSQNNFSRISSIVNSAIIFKIILVVFVFFIISIYFLLDSKYDSYKLYFILLSLPIVGQTFQPIWFFQGIEKMDRIMVYSIFAKITYLVVTLIVVKQESDYWLVAVTNGVAQIAAALIGIYMMWKLGWRWKFPNLRFFKITIKFSSQFFYSRLAVSLFTSAGTISLGLFSTSTQVAYYSVSEQIYKGIQSLVQPINQALYPYMVKSKDIVLIRKILILAVLGCIVSLIAGFLWGDWMLIFISGEEFRVAANVLQIFFITTLFNIPSILLGFPLLGAFGKVDLANKSVIYGGLLQILLLVVFISFTEVSAIIIAITVAITECFVFLLRLVWAYPFLKR